MAFVSDMNVAIFTDTFLPAHNGVTYSIVRQVEILRTQGHNVYVIGPSELSVSIGIQSKKVLRTRDERYPLRLPTTFCMSKLKGLELDIVHIHTPFAFGILGLRLARKIKALTVYSHHTNFEYYSHYFPALDFWLGRKAWHWYYGAFLAQVDKILTPSNLSRLDIIRNYSVDSERVFSVPTSIGMSKRHVSSMQEKYYDLIVVGRISQEKNYGLISESISAIVDEIPGVRIAIVGKGVDECKVRVNLSMSADGNVKFLGELDNDETIMAISKSSFLLTASLSETQALTVQEAWSVGVPVICVRCELMTSYIKHGENGWLAGNERNSLAKLATDLINSQAQNCVNVVQKCLESAKMFTPEIWLNEFNLVIDEDHTQ